MTGHTLYLFNHVIVNCFAQWQHGGSGEKLLKHGLSKVFDSGAENKVMFSYTVLENDSGEVTGVWHPLSEAKVD